MYKQFAVWRNVILNLSPDLKKLGAHGGPG